ncbi:DUF218 domain-containing protein [Herbihabitans rhizosphaerae]|uniref:DUF218 domain-containing protein n=1 Tax=Herbihabitans rhizosphaerae TaxID=1872711 RepID=A0A4Q7L564_9PSEU|nr:YdcF family protein [Herbihabitans rhizosphaerae]RZS44404.1 DUF218 domain-containing protein [Herbihabitans rhizosphaerae]
MRRVLAVAAALIVWGEVVHWRASRRLLGSAAPGPEVVVVLGFRNGGRRANAVNRWRVRAGLRSAGPGARIVFCGGSVGAEVPEAVLMARYAVDELGHTGPIVLEEESHSTWQNIQNAVPLIEDAGRIKIVSNSLHAQKARLYLRRQRPDLARRLVRADDYRAGEWAALKPVFAAYGLWTGWRARRTMADSEQ